MLLHKSSTPQSSTGVPKLQSADFEDLRPARSLVRRVLGDSLLKLQAETSKHTRSIRWELGACWVQHLQSQASGKIDSKKTEEVKVEPAVKGLGKQGGLLKEIKRKTEDKNSKIKQGKEVAVNGLGMDKKLDATDQRDVEKQDEAIQMIWKKLLPEAAYLRLKESETGLHLKVYLLLLYCVVFTVYGQILLCCFYKSSNYSPFLFVGLFCGIKLFKETK